MEAIDMPRTKDLFESFMVAYNQDLKECVISYNANSKDIRSKQAQAIKKLGSSGFDKVVLYRNKRVAAHNSSFEKVSIIPSTREHVFVYFYYVENEKILSFCRLSKVYALNETLTVNVSLINKHPGWTFKEYTIKEYFDYDRIKLILDLHFAK